MSSEIIKYSVSVKQAQNAVYKEGGGQKVENQKQPLEIKNVIAIMKSLIKNLENKAEKSSRNQNKMINRQDEEIQLLILLQSLKTKIKKMQEKILPKEQYNLPRLLLTKCLAQWIVTYSHQYAQQLNFRILG